VEEQLLVQEVVATLQKGWGQRAHLGEVVLGYSFEIALLHVYLGVQVLLHIQAQHLFVFLQLLAG
jgi:hypothetical protein